MLLYTGGGRNLDNEQDRICYGDAEMGCRY